MKKYTIVSLILLTSFFGAPLFASASSSSGVFDVDNFHGLIGEMAVFSDSVDEFIPFLLNAGRSLKGNAAAAEEFVFICNLSERIEAYSRQFIPVSMIKTKKNALYNLRLISQLLRSIAYVATNYTGIQLHYVDELIGTFFHARLCDSIVALLIKIDCQESWVVDDDFMHELMARIATLPCCKEIAPSCEKSYLDYFDTEEMTDLTDEMKKGKLKTGLEFLQKFAYLVGILTDQLDVKLAD